MSENGAVAWQIKGEEVGSCSCDWACPCQFEGDPTHGYCQVVGCIQIEEGNFGDVDLSGVSFGILVSFPGPLYEGNGSIQPILDEAASDEQRDAIVQMASGQHGGAFFEVFSSICPDLHEPLVTSIEVESDREARTARIRLGDIAQTSIEPIKSPATGEEHRVRIDLPHGFEFKQAEVGNTIAASASGADPLSFGFEGTYAQMNRFDWSSDTHAA
jgi:hypothetical protein